MKAPERTTADAFPTYIGGQVIADSATHRDQGKRDMQPAIQNLTNEGCADETSQTDD